MTSLRMLLACAVFLSTVPANKAWSLSTLAFFKNSKRRLPTQEEKDFTVRIGGGCTGFFVRNTAGKALIGTARHCVQMSINNWCSTGGSFKDNGGVKGTCEKVIAADVNHDIAVFQAKLSYVPKEENSLELAAYSPKLKQKLYMVGYPADYYKKGALTTTENCWITVEDVGSCHGWSMNDRSARHNCSTYGGNSGGPMLAEGTKIVVGLPFTYYPDDYTLYDADYTDYHALMAKMEDFVKEHRKDLDDASVVIVDKDPAP